MIQLSAEKEAINMKPEGYNRVQFKKTLYYGPTHAENEGMFANPIDIYIYKYYFNFK